MVFTVSDPFVFVTDDRSLPVASSESFVNWQLGRVALPSRQGGRVAQRQESTPFAAD